MAGRKIHEIAKRRELRSVVAVKLGGKVVVPAEKVGRPPRVELVDPRDLFIEAAYQRDVVERGLRLIRKIVENWDWTHFKTPVCARRAESGGTLVVIDGQHTAVAAVTHGGIAKIPVLVVDASQVGDRAEAFVAHNRDRVGLTPMQIHVARLAAGDPGAEQIQAACDKARVTIGRSYFAANKDAPPRTTIAIEALRITLKFHKFDQLVEIMRMLGDSGLAPISKSAIHAMGRTLELNPEIDKAKLVAAIGRKTAKEWATSAARARPMAATGNEALRAAWLQEMGDAARPLPAPAAARPSAQPKPEPEAVRRPGSAKSAATATLIQRNGVTIDLGLAQVEHRGRIVHLSDEEIDMVAALARVMPAILVTSDLARKIGVDERRIDDVRLAANRALAEARLEIKVIPKMGYALADMGAE